MLNENNIKLVLISMDSYRDKWKTEIRKNSILAYNNYLSLGGTESKLGLKFGINAVPTTILVDETGRILFVPMHLPDEKAIKMLIK